MDQRPLRVLSLDGGGVRGLSSLYLLRAIFDKLGAESALKEPWRYFDLIGGTSTGGLIAIMIGQLRMSVDDCIHEYGQLSQKVFGSRTGLARLLGPTGAAIVGGTEYHSTALEEELAGEEGKEGLLARYLPHDQRELLSKEEPLSNAKLLLPLGLQAEYPKVFVATLQQEASNLILLTNYTTDQNSQFKGFTILQAARATSAASTIFEPLQAEVGGVTYNFVDAGLGYNCPINLLMNEARRIWPDRPFGCVLSIGTGVQPPHKVGKTLKAVAETCRDMATSAQLIANDFYLGLESQKSDLLKVYFRLNVDQGLANVRLDEYEKLSSVGAFTTSYLRLHQKDLDEICKRLKAPLTQDGYEDRIALSNCSMEISGTQCYVDRIYTDGQGLEDQPYTSLIHYRLVNHRLPSKVALLGMGGAGKSQLALSYTKTYARYYAATLWIDMTNVSKSIAHIAHVLKVTGDSQERRLAAIHEWLLGHKEPWLLVLDNFDTETDFESIGDLCPGNLEGHILITSRNSDVTNLASSIIRIGPMSKPEAVRLLIKRVRGDDVERRSLLEMEEDNAGAEVVVEALGCLPIAVEIAGALTQTSSDEDRPSIAAFIKRLAEAPTLVPVDDLISKDPGWGFSYGRPSAWASETPAGIRKTLKGQNQLYRTLASVWSCSVEYLKRESPDSLRLLRLFGFLSLENLDRDLFRYAVQDSPLRKHEPASSYQVFEQEPLPDWLLKLIGKNGVFSGRAFDRAVGILQKLSLLSVLEAKDGGWGENPYRFAESASVANSTYQLHGLISRCIQVLSSEEERFDSLHTATALVSHLPFEFIHSGELMRVFKSARGNYDLELGIGLDFDRLNDWQHREGFKENILPHLVTILLNSEVILQPGEKLGEQRHLWSGQRFMLAFVEFGLFGPAACIWDNLIHTVTEKLREGDEGFSRLTLAYIFTFAAKMHARDRRWAEASRDIYMAASILATDLHRGYTMSVDELAFIVDCLMCIWVQSWFLDIVPKAQNVVKMLKQELKLPQEEIDGLQDLVDTIGQIIEKEIVPLVPDGCQNPLLKDLTAWANYFKHDVFLKLEDGPSDYDMLAHTTDWIAEVRNMMANSSDERLEFEDLAPGDLDEEIREAFRNHRYRNKRRSGILHAPHLLKLPSLFGSRKGKNVLPSLESREELWERKHQDKRWAKRSGVEGRDGDSDM